MSGSYSECTFQPIIWSTYQYIVGNEILEALDNKYKFEKAPTNS